jgi:gag-polypeptide of LTR copia-type
MQDHINKIMTLAEQLEAIGAAVRDDGIARTLLCSLPESYENPIIALKSCADDVSAELIRNRLLQKEARRK